MSYDSLSKLKNLNIVNGLEFVNSKVDKICDVCVKSKQKCFPYFSKTSRSTRVLELIHTDVCGPITPTSRDGNKYFVTFVDDFSRFVMVYPIKSKDEVFNCFKDYEAKVTSLFGKRISKLKCDNGGEYRSYTLLNLCSKRGIQIIYTPPYTPQLNGVAERMNQTLMNRARCMIKEAGISKCFWQDAVLMAAYITNRTQSCLVRDKSPFEMWCNKKPNVSNLRVFGCICYARVPGSIRANKLDDKRVKCKFVGYTDQGYRLWNNNENKIIHSRNVIFDESNLSMTSKNQMLNERVEAYENESDNEYEEENKEETNEKEEEVNVDENTEVNEVSNRPQRERKIPAHFENFQIDLGCLALLSASNVPETYAAAIKSKQSENWKQAMDEELNALEENKTWTLVEKPEHGTIISNRWVFRIKEDSQGKEIYKARLVARGFEQDINEISQIHAPVAKLSTFRILLSVCNYYNLLIEQLDVKNAFLNGIIEEVVYMKIPEGLLVSENDRNKVCQLNKAIYGLKQAPKVWNDRFNGVMLSLSFERSKSDYCLYVFVSKNDLLGFSDADWANSTNDRKSISGYCFKLFGDLVSWSSKKQSIVALSSTESEFISVCMASCEILHIKNLLNDLKITLNMPFLIHEDNQSTIKLLNNFENNKRCKHVDVKFHFVVDLITAGIIKIVYVSTDCQLADVFTKSLGVEKFTKFVKMLNLK